MRFIFLIGIYLFSGLVVQAQSLLLINDERDPIPNVLAINSNADRSSVSNQDGLLDLSVFAHDDIITLQHPSFIRKEMSMRQLSSLKYLMLEPKFYLADEVVISANKWEQDRSEIPNQILTISPRDVAIAEPQTAADLLQSSGEVFVQKSQLGGGSPMIRGFAANRVLLVVDGVRMNNAIFRSGNLQNVINIDPNALESAEVIFGPGSVIYGSDALGGVMDFHFVTPRLRSENLPAWSGSGVMRYSSANQEKTGSVQLGYSKNNWAIWSSFTYSSFDDLQTGSNRTEEFPDFGKREFYVARIGDEDVVVENPDENIQRFSGYNLWNNVTKIRFRPSKKVDLQYGFYFSNTSNIPRYDRLTQPGNETLFRNAEWFYGPQTWQMHQLRTTLTLDAGIFDEARIIVAYQNYEESRNDRRFQSESLRNRTEQVDIYSLNIDFNKELNANHELFYGVELLLNDVTSTAFRRNITTNEISNASTRYPDGGSEYHSEAIYVNYKWRIRPELIMNAGVRANFIGLNARTEDTTEITVPFEELTIQNGSVNGSLGLAYGLNAKSRLKLNFSTGFRAPNIDDVGKIFEGGNNVRVPNENLEPEYTYNAELTLERQLGSGVSTSITGFYTFLDNAIVESTDFQFNGEDSLFFDGELLKVEALVNAGSAYIYGASFNLDAALGEAWLLRSSLAFSDGAEFENKEPLRHTTPIFGRTTLTFRRKNLQAAVFFDYSGKRTADEIPATLIEDSPFLFTEDGSLAWWTANARFSYQFKPYLGLTFACENIFDKHYRTYSSGISAPGRNFVVSLRTRF